MGMGPSKFLPTPWAVAGIDRAALCPGWLDSVRVTHTKGAVVRHAQRERAGNCGWQNTNRNK